MRRRRFLQLAATVLTAPWLRRRKPALEPGRLLAQPWYAHSIMPYQQLTPQRMPSRGLILRHDNAHA